MTTQEIKDLLASIAERQEKTSQGLEQLKLSQEKTDEQIKKTDEQMKETAEQMKKTDEKLKSVGVQLGNMSKNQGDVAEEFFVNSLSTNLQVAGVQYDELHKNMHKRVKSSEGGKEGEFDIVLINGKDIAIIETKYKAHEYDLQDLLEKKHPTFQALYPEYKNYTHHLGLASFYISDELKNEALRNNVFILQRKGKLVESFLP